MGLPISVRIVREIKQPVLGRLRQTNKVGDTKHNFLLSALILRKVRSEVIISLHFGVKSNTAHYRQQAPNWVHVCLSMSIIMIRSRNSHCLNLMRVNSKLYVT
jgi:hypothetical protein